MPTGETRKAETYTYFGEGGQKLADWKRVEISFVATGPQRIQLEISKIHADGGNTYLLVTQCKLETGYFATPYSKCQ